MILTNKQEAGLKQAIERFRHGEKYTVIAGYAGTGKSTLVRFIIEALGLDEDDIVYASYTGKASEVLRKKGNSNAMTLHKLLYKSYPRPDGSFVRTKVPQLDYKLVIADECSMIPKEMVEQLMSYRGVHTIYLGDPFQIPPINPDEDNHLLDSPHCFLDEVMRQAAESEIIRVSMDIRAGKPLTNMRGNEVQIINANELSTGMLTWADQILVATNNKRIAINNQMRDLLGKTGTPQDGDKIICRRNYWDIVDDNYNPIINGTIGYLENSFESFVRLPYWIKVNDHRIDIIEANIIDECGNKYTNLSMDKKLFTQGNKSLDGKTEFLLSKRKMYHLIPLEFEYGYAITVHKAQGSEWDKVLVIEERFPFSAEEHARWLYTAATRASEKLVIVRKN